MSRAPVRSAADAGLMSGAPPFPPDRLVTLANWQDPPFNRWAFQHVRELVPTAWIAGGRRGGSPERARPLAPERLRGRSSHAIRRLLEETYTDGFLVLHRGWIVTERYFNDLTPDTSHLLMSVSKSVVSSVVGVLVGRGALHPPTP